MESKILIASYRCKSCGTINKVQREIIIDNYLKKLELPKSKCICGGKQELVDIEIKENYEKVF